MGNDVRVGKLDLGALLHDQDVRHEASIALIHDSRLRCTALPACALLFDEHSHIGHGFTVDIQDPDLQRRSSRRECPGRQPQRERDARRCPNCPFDRHENESRRVVVVQP